MVTVTDEQYFAGAKALGLPRSLATGFLSAWKRQSNCEPGFVTWFKRMVEAGGPNPPLHPTAEQISAGMKAMRPTPWARKKYGAKWEQDLRVAYEAMISANASRDTG